MTPKVSICVPTYNGEKYLPDCLESIISQTFSDFELLIIDDCSNDNTVNIIQNYAEKDRRIRLIQNRQNLGLIGNWNRCLENAYGEWIKFVFQDDMIAPNCLAAMLQASRNNVPIIFSQRELLFDSNVPSKIRKQYLAHQTIITNLFPGNKYISINRYCKAILDHIHYPGINLIGEPTVVMLHKSVQKKFGKFNPFFLQISDEEYWTRIAVHTGLIHIEEKLATFRVHKQSTSMYNHQKKYYRIGMIDPLIRIYYFLYDPIYEPFRQYLEKTESLDNMKLFFQKSVSKAWLKAKIDPRPFLKKEWDLAVNTLS